MLIEADKIQNSWTNRRRWLASIPSCAAALSPYDISGYETVMNGLFAMAVDGPGLLIHSGVYLSPLCMAVSVFRADHRTE